jgi:hypothetical protein
MERKLGIKRHVGGLPGGSQEVVKERSPEDAVHPGHDDVGGHLTNDVGVVFDAGSAGVGGPSVGLGGGAGARLAAMNGCRLSEE